MAGNAIFQNHLPRRLRGEVAFEVLRYLEQLRDSPLAVEVEMDAMLPL